MEDDGTPTRKGSPAIKVRVLSDKKAKIEALAASVGESASSHLRLVGLAAAVFEGQLDLPADQLAEWRYWAEREADKLDPVLSGKVQAHLLAPRCDGSR